MKEIRITVPDHLVRDLLDTLFPLAHRIVIDDLPEEPQDLLSRSLAANRVTPRRFPPGPIVQEPLSPPLQGVPTPAPVPPGHTRVQAHYNGARYVPEHVRPNPLPHRRRPPLAKTEPSFRKAQILDLLRSRHPVPVTRRAIDGLARQSHDHSSHWRNTVRGLVRYKRVVRDGDTYALPSLPPLPKDPSP